MKNIIILTLFLVLLSTKVSAEEKYCAIGKSDLGQSYSIAKTIATNNALLEIVRKKCGKTKGEITLTSASASYKVVKVETKNKKLYTKVCLTSEIICK